MDIANIEPGHTIEMYVSPDCPYCREAIAHFTARAIPHTTYDAQNDSEMRKRMFSHTKDDPTVPAILIDGTYVQSGWGIPPQG